MAWNVYAEIIRQHLEYFKMTIPAKVPHLFIYLFIFILGMVNFVTRKSKLKNKEIAINWFFIQKYFNAWKILKIKKPFSPCILVVRGISYTYSQFTYKLSNEITRN